MTEQSDAAPVFASWLSQLGALLADFVPVIVLFVVLAALFGENEVSDHSVAIQLNGFPALVHLVATLGWFVFNWILRQGKTGQTVGKKALGIGVYKAGTTEPLGSGNDFRTPAGARPRWTAVPRRLPVPAVGQGKAHVRRHGDRQPRLQGLIHL